MNASLEELKAHLDGDLSPERSAAIAADPTLVAELSRLRAIAAAIADEREIPVVGRERTLSSLAARNRPARVGIPRWTWAVGMASVVGLILISLPKPSREVFTIRNASYDMNSAEAAAPATPLVFESEPNLARKEAADSSALAEEVQAGASMASPTGQLVTPSSTRANETARSKSISLRVEDVLAVHRELEAAAKAAGVTVLFSKVTSSNGLASALVSLKVPSPVFERFVRKTKSFGELLHETQSIGKRAQVRTRQGQSSVIILNVTFEQRP